MANSYPVEILPKREFELRLDIHSLMKVYPNLCVSRRVDGEREKLVIPFDGGYVLDDAALRGVKASNFSVNLLGGLFKTERHIHYRPLGPITQLWYGNDIQQDISEDKYERKHPCFAVYYRITDFLKFPIEEKKSFYIEKEYHAFIAKTKVNDAEMKYVNAFKKGEEMVFVVNKRANHMPTCCNYWHVTFDTYSFDAPQTPIVSSGTRKSIERMLNHLRHDFLTMQGIINIPEYDAIAPYFYQKGKGNVLKRKFITCVCRMGRLFQNGLE